MAISLNVGNPSSTTIGSDIQAMLCFTLTPRIEPLAGICAVLPGEITPGTTFATTMIGVVARTYLGFTLDGVSPSPVSTGGGATAFAVLWE
jgi:hypothetical protein